MGDRWNTFTINLEGGLIENLSELEQGINLPGSLRDGYNFEPSTIGGYKKINGFAKFDTNVVTGSGDILGVFPFKGKAIACRGTGIYESSGSGWTLIHTQPSSPTTHYMADRYNYGAGDKIILVTGANKSVTWDGTTLVTLANSPTGASDVKSFANHMFYAVGDTIEFSAPNDETDHTVANGAGVVNTGSTKIGLGQWRESLYVFGAGRIAKVEGTASVDFTLKNVTSQVGTVDNKTIRELSGDLYYLSTDGVRTISGTDKIGDTQLESVTRVIPDTIEDLPFLDSTYTISSVAVAKKSQYRVYTGITSILDREAKGILGGLRLNSQGNLALEWYQTRGFNSIYSDSDVYENVELVLHADFDGYIHEEENGAGQNGSDLHAFFRLPFWPLEDNEVRKTFHTFRSYIDANLVVNPVLSYTLDYLDRRTLQPPSINLGTGAVGFSFYGSAVYGTSIYGDDLSVTPKVNILGSGSNVSFAITANDQLGAFSVQNFTLEYSIQDRR